MAVQVLMDREQIKGILPHRDPFLFVDRITEMDLPRRIVGERDISKDDPVFKGHFPGNPIYPGVLLVESMSQVGGVLVLSLPESKGKLVYFMKLEEVKFRKPVLPGDTVRMVSEPIQLRSRTGRVKCEAYVGEDKVCEGIVLFAIMDPPPKGGLGT